ncbi:MAG: hypothetical protein BWX80_03074 [Candidatus Hydrogenedentes bacterium ADurb.Bin101]|nr:MAG: hypothetical protein BWX80_03074 [Candidatus Hydrogenedentes bacterium ADurb.Bin101]
MGNQPGRIKGKQGKQAASGGGNSFHKILIQDCQGRLRAGRVGVHMQPQPLHQHKIPGVEVASAPVGGGVSEPLADRPARFIGGQFQPLHIDGELFTAEFFRQALGAFRQQVADATPVRNVFKHLRQGIGPAKMEPAVPQPLFLELHGEGDGAARRHGVHAEFIQLVIELQDLFQVVVQ